MARVRVRVGLLFDIECFKRRRRNNHGDFVTLFKDGLLRTRLRTLLLSNNKRTTLLYEHSLKRNFQLLILIDLGREREKNSTVYRDSFFSWYRYRLVEPSSGGGVPASSWPPIWLASPSTIRSYFLGNEAF